MIHQVGELLAVFGLIGAGFTLLALYSDRIGPALAVAKHRRVLRKMRRRSRI